MTEDFLYDYDELPEESQEGYFCYNCGFYDTEPYELHGVALCSMCGADLG